MLSRLVAAILMVLALTTAGAAQNQQQIRVPDLSVFANGEEMLGALSAIRLRGRITAMAAPSVDQEGKFGQFPEAGSMLAPGGEVLIFRYDKYVPPEQPALPTTSTAAKDADPMQTMIAGPDAAFVGNYSGFMTTGSDRAPITVSITNSGTWSLIVSTGSGTIGGDTGTGEVTAMEGGALVYRLEGGSYRSTLSVKVNGDDLAGELVTVLGSGAVATQTVSVLSATRTR